MERIAFPALRGLGRRWVEASASVAAIQFAVELLRRELCAELARAEELSSGRPLVLLACVDDEMHDLGLLTLAVLLRQRDIRTKYFGACIPCEDLVEAAKSIGPAAVCLSATTSSSVAALNRVARKMLICRVPAQLFVGGPGLVRQQAPGIPGIQLPQSLVSATERVAAAVGETRAHRAAGSEAAS